MILSKKEILKYLDDGKIVIDPLDINNVFETGIKLHIDPKVKKITSDLIDLTNLSAVQTSDHVLSEDGYIMDPGEYLMGETLERIKLPVDVWGLLDTRGSFAKVGLKLLFDYHVDPGSDAKMVVHIKNLSNSKIKIYPNLYSMRVTLFRVL